MVQGSVSDVAFVLRALLPRLPSARYDPAEVSEHLKSTISAALSTIKPYMPLLQVVYAYLALDDRPRAVDFETACQRIAHILAPFDATAPLNRVNKLGVYLAMAYHALFFVRVGRSPFVAVSTSVYDAVQKVMYALTQTELEHGVAEMKLKTASWIGITLRDFLEHWALWNDSRLARAVVAILEKSENDKRTIDSPHAISSALDRLDGIRLFPWVSTGRPYSPLGADQLPSSAISASSPPRASPDPASDPASDAASDASFHTSDTLSGASSDASPDAQPDSSDTFSGASANATSATSSVATSEAALENPFVELGGPSLFTSNLAHECTLLDTNTAVDVSKEDTSPRLNVYIPYVSLEESVLGKISPVGTRGRTVQLGGKVVGMLPTDVVARSAFQHGVPRQALQLGLTYNWRTQEWDPASASHAVVEIIPHEPSDGFDFSTISRLLSTFSPVLSDHELQIPVVQTELRYGASATETPETNHMPSPEIQGLLSTQAQAAGGRIAALAAQKEEIEVPYLSTIHGQEVISGQPAWHERIQTHSYAPVGRPLDSSLSLLTQNQLTKALAIPAVTESGAPRASLVAKAQEIIEPQLQLALVLEDRDKRFWALRTLELQLQESGIFHIYRCIVLQASLGNQKSGQKGHLLPAYCLDLDVNIEVYVPAHTEQLFPGDQVIGTEILELDPLQGLFIVSI